MVRKGKPNWWLVYALVPLMIALLVIESQMPCPPMIHQIAESGIVLLIFGLILLWVHANEAALIHEEIEKEPWTFEPDPAAQAAIDPARVSSGDGCDDSGDGQQRLEASPRKGRYN